LKEDVVPTTEIPDLWPADLTGPTTLTPVVILRRQGEALASRTHNLVRGEVETRPFNEGKSFEHNFVLVAPFLRFRFPLLRVSHRVSGYPATIAETDLTKPEGVGGYWSETAQNEEEMQQKLQIFFNQNKVKAVIRSLLDQSSEPETDSSSPTQPGPLP
jgi:hypothetical protein